VTELQADWLVHPYAYELEVRVIDPLGLPVERHTVKLCPIGCTRNLADVGTDADGRAVIRWHGRTARMTVEVEDPRGQARRIAIQSGNPSRLLLLGRASEQGPELRISVGGREVRYLSGLPLVSFFGPGQAGQGQMRSGLHPFARFSDPSAMTAQPPAEAQTTEVVINLGEALRMNSITFTPTVATEGNSASGAATLPAAAAIAGTVLAADGSACRDVPVVLLGSGPQPLQRTATDEHGAFRFENCVAGDFTVRAGGDRDGLAVTPVVVTTGTTPISLQLHPGAAVRGRALATDGTPCTDCTIEWRSLDGSWVDSTTTDRDGAFVLANLPGGPGTVQLLPPGRASQQPRAVMASVLPDNGELILRVPVSPGSTLQLQPFRVDDLAERPVLRVWNIDTGLGTRIQAPDEGDVWKLADLPAGFYDLDAWVPGAGHRMLGRHWLDGTAPVDLGRVELPRGGTVHFSIAADALPTDEAQRVLELVSLRTDADVFVALEEIPNDRVVHLPADDHAVLYRHADGAPRALRFAVKAGERTEVTVVR
jgi:hypothetical protein